MKTFVTAAVSIALLSAGPSARPSQSAAIFILAGQSNMVGQGRVADLDERERQEPANLEFYLAGERGSMLAQPGIGPEVSLAAALSQAMPDRRIVFIKYAVGGTSLLAWAPDWTPEGAATTGNKAAGPLYRQLLDQVIAIAGDNQQALAAVFWMQGERDARYPAAASAYERNFTAFIQRIRRDLKAPDLPFIYGQVNPPANTYTGLTAVRAAQVKVAETVAGATLVATDDLSKRPDNLHYDTRGQLELGRRFARAYLALR